MSATMSKNSEIGPATTTRQREMAIVCAKDNRDSGAKPRPAEKQSDIFHSHHLSLRVCALRVGCRDRA
eukprot:6187827-Pleurochrysis_carterae.AAC.3